MQQIHVKYHHPKQTLHRSVDLRKENKDNYQLYFPGKLPAELMLQISQPLVFPQPLFVDIIFLQKSYEA
jgi:hypothetical protein